MGPLTVPERYCIVKMAPADCDELGSYRRPLVAAHEADEHDVDAIHWKTRVRKGVNTEENTSHEIGRACINLQGEVLLRKPHLYWYSVRSANQWVE